MVKQSVKIIAAVVIAIFIPLILLSASNIFPNQKPATNSSATMEPEPYSNGQIILSSESYAILLFSCFVVAVVLTVIFLWFTKQRKQKTK